MKSHIFLLVGIFLLSKASAQVQINDTRFGSFNVQVRYLPIVTSEIVRPQYKCLGTLISLRHVLTAASCVSNLVMNRILLSVGSTAMLNDGDDSVGTTVTEIYLHPDYVEGKPLQGNVAVMRVSKREIGKFLTS